MLLSFQNTIISKETANIFLNHFVLLGLSGFVAKPNESGPQPSFTTTTTQAPPQNFSCIHECKENGGCSVKLETKRRISGAVMGSCFPPDFGGSCSGIPELCTACNEVCTEEYYGTEVVVRYDETGKNYADCHLRKI